MRSHVSMLLLLLACSNAEARELRVCADPNNLPFSNRAGEGFENRIAEIVAKELDADLVYTWWAQRRGALRNTIRAGKCDVVPGIAAGVEGLSTTRPYYRASYVFVARRDGRWAGLSSFDDPRLRDATIGVQLIGDDGANTPPAHALARRGMYANIRGFTVYGDYADAAPQSDIVAAVADGRVDVAAVWGPTADYFARRFPSLQLAPVTPWLDGPQWPMTFEISFGVRREDRELRRELDRALERHATEIAKILEDFGVPVESPDPATGSN